MNDVKFFTDDFYKEIRKIADEIKKSKERKKNAKNKKRIPEKE